MPKSDKAQGLPGKCPRLPSPYQSWVWASLEWQEYCTILAYLSQLLKTSCLFVCLLICLLVCFCMLSHHSPSLFHTLSQISFTYFWGPCTAVEVKGPSVVLTWLPGLSRASTGCLTLNSHRCSQCWIWRGWFPTPPRPHPSSEAPLYPSFVSSSNKISC